MVLYKIFILISITIQINCQSDYCQLEQSPKACNKKPHIACNTSETGLPDLESEVCVPFLLIEICLKVIFY